MFKHLNRSWLAFCPESNVCEPPANAAAWVSSGTCIEHLAVDTSGVVEALVVDPTLERTPDAVGKRRKLRGLRGAEASASVKLHGLGVATAVGDQAPETYLTKILAH